MTLNEIAERSGVTLEVAENSLAMADEVIYLEHGVCTRKSNMVHLAAFAPGLGWRKTLKECEKVLDVWLNRYQTLFAPVRHDNPKAVRIAMALGFTRAGRTATHVLLRRDHHEQKMG